MMNRPRRAVVLVLVGELAACAPAVDRARREGSPTTVALRDVPVRGYRVEVTCHTPKNGWQEEQGELLAVDRRHLWLLDREHRVVWSVEVELFPSYAGAYATWVVLGVFSTLSHGGFLLISAPVWVAAGTSAIVSAARGNDIDVSGDELGQLYQYARFPAGLPPGWRAVKRVGRPPMTPARAPRYSACGKQCRVRYNECRHRCVAVGPCRQACAEQRAICAARCVPAPPSSSPSSSGVPASQPASSPASRPASQPASLPASGPASRPTAAPHGQR